MFITLVTKIKKVHHVYRRNTTELIALTRITTLSWQYRNIMNKILIAVGHWTFTHTKQHTKQRQIGAEHIKVKEYYAYEVSNIPASLYWRQRCMKGFRGTFLLNIIPVFEMIKEPWIFYSWINKLAFIHLCGIIFFFSRVYFQDNNTHAN